MINFNKMIFTLIPETMADHANCMNNVVQSSDEEQKYIR